MINAIANSQYWKDTAIIIAYDDSDGWYDHVLGPVVNQSAVADDALAGAGDCGAATAATAGGTQGRCGYGPRLPLLVISPYAKQNYIDHRATDQSSILRFIEDNWDLGRIGNDSSDVKAGKLNGMFDFDDHNLAPKLILDPSTGVILKSSQRLSREHSQRSPHRNNANWLEPIHRLEPVLFRASVPIALRSSPPLSVFICVHQWCL